MSIKGYDFEINGVKYNAAEDAEGDHYVVTSEPLRPPNAVTVQGESSQKFQMRPDTLQWTITNWAGGEGQIKFDPQAPDRHRELTGVRVFERPGTLQPGYYMEDTQDSSGSSDFAIAGQMAEGVNGLFLLDFSAANRYQWLATKWGAATALTGASAGVEINFGKITADEDSIYWIEDNTTIVWKVSPPSAPATISTTDITVQTTALDQLGPYVYAVDPVNGEVWEIPKSGAAATQIDDFSDETGALNKSWTIPMDGKLYVAFASGAYTLIREITPSSAAGVGFGAEIGRLPGFKIQSLWQHSGVLYLGGSMNTSDEDVIMYLSPGGNYGTIGRVRPGDDIGDIIGQHTGGAMLEHYFAIEQIDGSTARQAIYQVDSVSGGMAMLSYNEDGDSADDTIHSLAVHKGDIFLSNYNGASPERVMRARADQYVKTSEAISPWHDFDLADEKILGSLVLSTEALPADWTVNVDYAIDGSTSFTTGITYTTTGGKGTKLAISTDSSTKKFRTLSIRIRMTYTGAGVPTSGPVILGVDVLAMVAKPTKVWRLMLGLSDSHSAQRGTSGSKLITNLETATALQKVIDFKDGYQNRDTNKFIAHDVVIDTYSILLTKPGEGIGMVVLKELP